MSEMAPASSARCQPVTGRLPRQKKVQDQWQLDSDRVKTLYRERQYKQCAALCDVLLGKTTSKESSMHQMHKTYLYFFAAVCYESLGLAAHKFSCNKLPLLKLAKDAFASAVESLAVVSKSDEAYQCANFPKSAAISEIKSHFSSESNSTGCTTPISNSSSSMPELSFLNSGQHNTVCAIGSQSVNLCSLASAAEDPSSQNDCTTPGQDPMTMFLPTNSLSPHTTTHLISFRLQLHSHIDNMNEAIGQATFWQKEKEEKQHKRRVSSWSLEPAIAAVTSEDQQALEKSDRLQKLKNSGWPTGKARHGWKGEAHYEELRKKALEEVEFQVTKKLEEAGLVDMIDEEERPPVPT